VADQHLKLSRRQIGVGLTAIVVLVIAYFCWQAVTASRALTHARHDANMVQKQIHAGDFTGASRSLDALRSDAHTAHNRTGGPLWDITKHIPYVGRNIGAVQTVAHVLDTATSINAPIALQLSRSLSQGAFRPVNGRIDVAAVTKLTPEVQKAASSIDQAGEQLDSIRSGKLIFPFNDLVGDLQDQVDQARSAANATASAFDLLPQMLGADGPRTYLLMIQNPAELRATGGLPGSLAILHADDGRLTMGWQGSAGDINPSTVGFPSPVVALPKETLDEYGQTPATDFRDLNFSPDFPQAAQIARAMVKRRLGVSVDGVVSVDPVALSYMMIGTGPIAVADNITLTAATVAPTLLNETYKNIQDAAAQDTFNESVARSIFDAVMGGQGNQQLAVSGLGAATSQHRVLIWSSRSDEEARFAGTAVGGVLEGKTGNRPQVGLFINDSTAGKMDYYLQYRSSVSAVDCRDHGAQDLHAVVTLGSNVPKDFSSLGPFILGSGEFTKKGDIAFNLRLYAPAGGEVTGLTIDGKEQTITADPDHGRTIAFLPITLTPGQRMTVTADITTAKNQSGDGVLDFTPGLLPVANGTKIASACD
jgi:hypothetical protein